MPDVSQQFLNESRDFLTNYYLPEIERCVARLTDDQLWWRANEASNSIGNILVHLAGSSRFWAAEVIGGEPIGRVRQLEFDQRGPVPAAQLLDGLRASVDEVERRLSTLSAGALLEKRKARSEEVTVLFAVYHIVEHFAMHTGQVLSMTKALVGEVRE